MRVVPLCPGILPTRLFHSAGWRYISPCGDKEEHSETKWSNTHIHTSCTASKSKKVDIIFTQFSVYKQWRISAQQGVQTRFHDGFTGSWHLVFKYEMIGLFISRGHFTNKNEPMSKKCFRLVKSSYPFPGVALNTSSMNVSETANAVVFICIVCLLNLYPFFLIPIL